MWLLQESSLRTANQIDN